MAKLYTLDDKLLTEVPEVRVGDKVYPVDNRQKTVMAIQRAMEQTDADPAAQMSGGWCGTTPVDIAVLCPVPGGRGVTEIPPHAPGAVALGGVVAGDHGGVALVVYEPDAYHVAHRSPGLVRLGTLLNELGAQLLRAVVTPVKQGQRLFAGLLRCHQSPSSKSSALTSTARPAAMAALRACGLMSLCALARISASSLSQTSGFSCR